MQGFPWPYCHPDDAAPQLLDLTEQLTQNQRGRFDANPRAEEGACVTGALRAAPRAARGAV